jgi:hypothetical protein
MRSKFRLELDVVLDASVTPSVIEAARQCYAADGAVATADENGAVRTLSAEEFIDEIEDALMELSGRNPLLANAKVEIERVACRAAEAELIDDAEPEGSGSDASGEHEDPLEDRETEDDLEEFETGLYLCRWPNGEFSLVKADDRKDAVVQLDEWAGAEPAWLVPVETCMVDFRLNDRGEIELAEFGEETAEFIWDKCYPKLDEVLSSDDVLKHLSIPCRGILREWGLGSTAASIGNGRRLYAHVDSFRVADDQPDRISAGQFSDFCVMRQNAG